MYVHVEILLADDDHDRLDLGLDLIEGRFAGEYSQRADQFAGVHVEQCSRVLCVTHNRLRHEQLSRDDEEQRCVL